MKTYNDSNTLAETIQFLSKRIGLATLLVGMGITFSMSANAASPVAGTLISNTAHASYSNAAGVPQTPVDSNTVTTTVSPVGSYTLTTSQSYTVNPGDTKFLLHTVTNTGNTDDIFHISVPLAVPSSLTTVQVIKDDNNDGIHQPTETTVLCTVTGSNTCTFDTPNLTAGGGTYNFFVEAIVASSATVGDVATANVVATPATPAVYTVPSILNTDTLTVSATVFNVVKSITTATSGTWNSTAGQTITYKLAYQNTGTAPGPLYIEDTIGATDALSNTTGFTYKAGTGSWNDGTSHAVTDASDVETTTGIAYEVTGTPGTNPNKIKIAVSSVPAGASGYVTFNVRVKDATILGTTYTDNVAYFGMTSTPTSPTNNSAFDVLVSGAFILEKYQALGTWSAGSCGAAGAYVKTGLSQTPGNCIWYRVIATNGTTDVVKNISINDTTPTDTTYAGGVACTQEGTVTGTATATAPTAGNVGTVDCSTWTTVPAGKWTQMDFAVRINP
jgi:hypothetical protein